MEEKLSPEQFVEKEYGIEMQKTTLITYLDGVMKQPSLSFLMNEYSKYVVNYKESLKNENVE
jgi:hypothetical protein